MSGAREGWVCTNGTFVQAHGSKMDGSFVASESGGQGGRSGQGRRAAGVTEEAKVLPFPATDLPGPGASAVICGLGTWLPSRVVTNADIAARLDTSEEWIRDR